MPSLLSIAVLFFRINSVVDAQIFGYNTFVPPLVPAASPISAAPTYPILCASVIPTVVTSYITIQPDTCWTPLGPYYTSEVSPVFASGITPGVKPLSTTSSPLFPIANSSGVVVGPVGLSGSLVTFTAPIVTAVGTGVTLPATPASSEVAPIFFNGTSLVLVGTASYTPVSTPSEVIVSPVAVNGTSTLVVGTGTSITLTGYTPPLTSEVAPINFNATSTLLVGTGTSAVTLTGYVPLASSEVAPVYFNGTSKGLVGTGTGVTIPSGSEVAPVNFNGTSTPMFVTVSSTPPLVGYIPSTSLVAPSASFSPLPSVVNGSTPVILTTGSSGPAPSFEVSPVFLTKTTVINGTTSVAVFTSYIVQVASTTPINVTTPTILPTGGIFTLSPIVSPVSFSTTGVFNGTTAVVITPTGGVLTTPSPIIAPATFSTSGVFNGTTPVTLLPSYSAPSSVVGPISLSPVPLLNSTLPVILTTAPPSPAPSFEVSPVFLTETMIINGTTSIVVFTGYGAPSSVVAPVVVPTAPTNSTTPTIIVTAVSSLVSPILFSGTTTSGNSTIATTITSSLPLSPSFEVSPVFLTETTVINGTTLITVITSYPTVPLTIAPVIPTTLSTPTFEVSPVTFSATAVINGTTSTLFTAYTPSPVLPSPVPIVSSISLPTGEANATVPVIVTSALATPSFEVAPVSFTRTTVINGSTTVIVVTSTPGISLPVETLSPIPFTTIITTISTGTSMFTTTIVMPPSGTPVVLPASSSPIVVIDTTCSTSLDTVVPTELSTLTPLSIIIPTPILSPVTLTPVAPVTITDVFFPGGPTSLTVYTPSVVVSTPGGFEVSPVQFSRSTSSSSTPSGPISIASTTTPIAPELPSSLVAYLPPLASSVFSDLSTGGALPVYAGTPVAYGSPGYTMTIGLPSTLVTTVLTAPPVAMATEAREADVQADGEELAKGDADEKKTLMEDVVGWLQEMIARMG